MQWENNLVRFNLSDKFCSWLQNSGSMTKLLQSIAVNQQVDIKVIKQKLESCNKELERIVLMLGMNDPWLYARSYFTKDAVDYFGKDLINLGTSPLGGLIAKHNTKLSRSGFEFTALCSDDQLYIDVEKMLAVSYGGLNSNKLIARRSVFALYDNKKNIPLFSLEEVFLPNLINKIENCRE